MFFCSFSLVFLELFPDSFSSMVKKRLVSSDINLNYDSNPAFKAEWQLDINNNILYMIHGAGWNPSSSVTIHISSEGLGGDLITKDHPVTKDGTFIFDVSSDSDLIEYFKNVKTTDTVKVIGYTLDNNNNSVRIYLESNFNCDVPNTNCDNVL